MALKELLTSMTAKTVKPAKSAPKDKVGKQPREAGPGARGWAGRGGGMDAQALQQVVGLEGR